jgi:ubiquitin carboxyl-terminal hydrolase 14
MLANINKDTGHLTSCLESSMEESVVKTSESLGRDAQYTKTSKLSRAPGYLAINFKRFHYKQKEQAACKIRKDVKFQLELDVMPLCSKELVEKLKPQRNAFEAQRDAAIAKEVTGYKEEESAVEFEPFSFPDDPGSNNSGYYELEAVLTHKGPDTSSGHYVAWCKQKNGTWLLFDDDKVTVQKEKDILELSGKSADAHVAYIVLYGPKRLPKLPAGGGGAAAAAAPAADAPASMDVAADPK